MKIPRGRISSRRALRCGVGEKNPSLSFFPSTPAILAELITARLCARAPWRAREKELRPKFFAGIIQRGIYKANSLGDSRLFAAAAAAGSTPSTFMTDATSFA